MQQSCIYLFNISTIPINSFLIACNLAAVVASNLNVKLGPVLDALTNAQPFLRYAFTPSVVEYSYPLLSQYFLILFTIFHFFLSVVATFISSVL